MLLVSKSKLPLETLLVLCISCLYFFLLLYEDATPISLDGYYHYKFAFLMWEEGVFWKDVSWLPYTVLGDNGVDHHWFFHLLIAPIAGLFSGSEDGLLFATALVGAIAPAGVYLFLRLVKFPYALLITLAVIFSHDFLPTRFLMLRMQPIALVIFIFAIYFLCCRYYLAQFILAFAALNFYHGGILLLFILGVWLLLDYFYHKKIDLKPFIAVLGGLLAALIINPWYPNTIEYLMFHTIYKVFQSLHVESGVEWYPFPINLFLSFSWIAHVGMLVALLVLLWLYRIQKLKAVQPLSLMFFVIACLFLLMYFKSMRFLSFYGPFSILALSFLLFDFIRITKYRLLPFRIQYVLPVIFTFTACYGLFSGSQLVLKGVRTNEMKEFKAVGQYIDLYSKPGDLVFNANWSDFVKIFWFSTKVNVINGLDPHYLAYQNWDKYKLWANLAVGNFDDSVDVIKILKKDLGVRWVTADQVSKKMVEKLFDAPSAHMILATETHVLFEIK